MSIAIYKNYDTIFELDLQVYLTISFLDVTILGVNLIGESNAKRAFFG